VTAVPDTVVEGLEVVRGSIEGHRIDVNGHLYVARKQAGR
jgi:hypothetical protein